jgi:hypothetical protein
MKSNLISNIKLDYEKIDHDLSQLCKLQVLHFYDQVTCSGHFRSATIFANGDITNNGNYVENIVNILKTNFKSNYIKFARLFIFSPNSVMMPHVDHIKTVNNLLRLHIPLKTNQCCFHSEHNTVYQMHLGEVWTLDTSTAHSVACLGTEERVHLVIDFDETEILLEEIIQHQLSENFEIANKVTRINNSPELIEKLYNLANIIDESNFFDIFAIVLKTHYKVQSHILETYKWMSDIVHINDNTRLIDLVQYWQDLCLNPRI